MVLWKSPHPDLEIPTDLTTWQWCFESPQYSPLLSRPSGQPLGSYVDASTGERLDFSQVKDLATRLSSALVRKCGLQAGDTVSIFASNTIWYPVAMFAAVRVGGRVNGASPAYGHDEMVHALKTAGTKVLFTLPGNLDIAVSAAEAAGLAIENMVLLEGSTQGFRTLQDLVQSDDGLDPVPCWSIPKSCSNRDVCGMSNRSDRYLNFSSGTTGLPKAVMLSHHNIIAQCLQLRQLQVVSPGDRYRILAVMPLFHITGLVRFCHYPVLMNGNCYMLTRFDFEDMLKNIIKHRIEELILVPPILIRIVKDPTADKYMPELRRCVKRWSSGSAPISPEIIHLLQQKFPDTGFRQGYGATESTACISAHPPSHFDYKYATTGGKLVANTIAKVLSIDDPTRELGPGETGEICARGPQIAMGYLENPTATAETFQNGFLHTGDVGYIDEEGLIHISDRIKEMIKVKGQQVAPAELEDLLLGHDAVEDVAVLSVADAYSGERPKAVVVVKKHIRASEEVGQQLMAFVREKKIRYKWLVELEFADSVPKSPTGKLLRRVLKVREKDEGGKKGIVVRDGRERAKL